MGAESIGVTSAGRVLLLLIAALWFPVDASAQEPPDTAIADTLVADTTAAALDSLAADSVVVDTMAVDSLPGLARGPQVSSRAGVWEWADEEMRWLPGLTLGDLLREVPGVWSFQAGDYGTPVAAMAFGAGAGRVRVRIDGVEWAPYEAGLAELSQVSLAGIGRVRVHRSVGGLLIDLFTVVPEDARAFSLIEVGTGDLNTNLFRGTFVLPGALGGTLAGALDRVDTDGPQREEDGALTGIWLKYGLLRGRRGGLEFDFRRHTVKRSLYVPGEFTRGDWTVRGRVRLAEGVVAGAHYTGSSLESKDEAVADSVGILAPSIRQVGLDISGRWERAWARGSGRWLDAPGLPTMRLDLEAGAEDTRYGGVNVIVARESWGEGPAASRTTLQGWTTDRYWVYGFAEFDQGRVGIPWVPTLDSGFVRPDTAGFTPFDPGLRLEDRTTRRVGAGVRWRGLEIEAAQVQVEVDSIFPLGLPVDRGPLAVPGGSRSGLELRANVPLPILDGLAAQGDLVRWDTVDGSWPYLPRAQYDARLHYRQTFLPTGNFEMQVAVGVREREAMSVFAPTKALPAQDPLDPLAGLAELDQVRFFQSWYGRLQLRIVSLHVFVEWENFTLRRANQDFPDRILPQTRSLYGVRWTLRN